MFMMPILLVFIITIVQDSTFKLVNDNNIEIIVVNKDEGALGDSLSNLLGASGAFKITERNKLSAKNVEETLLGDNQYRRFKQNGFDEIMRRHTNHHSWQKGN